MDTGTRENIKHPLGSKLSMNLIGLQSYTGFGEKKLLFHSMDINDSNNLAECNDEERHRAHVAVENLHPVVARSQREEESRQEGYQTDDR